MWTVLVNLYYSTKYLAVQKRIQQIFVIPSSDTTTVCYKAKSTTFAFAVGLAKVEAFLMQQKDYDTQCKDHAW